jgi:hypothetical protein
MLLKMIILEKKQVSFIHFISVLLPDNNIIFVRKKNDIYLLYKSEISRNGAVIWLTRKSNANIPIQKKQGIQTEEKEYANTIVTQRERT